jgi:hypothetical protein
LAKSGIIEKSLVKHLQASLNKKSFTVSFSFSMVEAENSIGHGIKSISTLTQKWAPLLKRVTIILPFVNEHWKKVMIISLFVMAFKIKWLLSLIGTEPIKKGTINSLFFS